MGAYCSTATKLLIGDTQINYIGKTLAAVAEEKYKSFARIELIKKKFKKFFSFSFFSSSLRDLKHLKTRNHSHVDIWVEPKCFLRHHGPSRIHRVAKSMKMSVEHIRWLAKITYRPQERYGLPELMQIGKVLTQNVPGISCTWIHPRIESRYVL